MLAYFTFCVAAVNLVAGHLSAIEICAIALALQTLCREHWPSADEPSNIVSQATFNSLLIHGFENDPEAEDVLRRYLVIGDGK